MKGLGLGVGSKAFGLRSWGLVLWGFRDWVDGNIGALIVRIRFCGPLHYNYNEEPLKLMSAFRRPPSNCRLDAERDNAIKKLACMKRRQGFVFSGAFGCKEVDF